MLGMNIYEIGIVLFSTFMGYMLGLLFFIMVAQLVVYWKDSHLAKIWYGFLPLVACAVIVIWIRDVLACPQYKGDYYFLVQLGILLGIFILGISVLIEKIWNRKKT